MMQDWMFEVEAAPASDAYRPWALTDNPWEEPATPSADDTAWSQSLLAPTSPGPEDVAAAFGLIEPGDDDFVVTPQSQSYALTDVVVTGTGWAPSGGGPGGGWGTGGSYDGNPELTNNSLTRSRDDV